MSGSRTPLRAPLPQRWRIFRAVIVPVLAVWSLIAVTTLAPGPVGSVVVALVSRDDGPLPGRPGAETCAEYAADGRRPVTGHTDPDGTLRVFAIQYRIDLGHVRSYDEYRTAMRCLMETMVEPNRVPGQPTLVAFPEDIGLPTILSGRRGATVRAQASTPLRAPLSDAVPAGLGTAMLQLNTAYSPQIAAYQLRFGPLDPRKQVLLGATDTFVRAFNQTFAEIAIDYGVYVVAGNTQAAHYREARNPLEVVLFADPAELPTGTAYVATTDRVTNNTYLWGPDITDPDAPGGAQNLLFRNEKLPVTPLEQDLIAVDEGPDSGLTGRINAGPVEVEGFRLGFATSLPAFRYGYDFGDRPDGLEPCADLRETYVACQDELGVDVMIQADANPFRWASDEQDDGWQPLAWMSSTWRAVADPSVGFRYNVTPMMTGNLLDLVFDGQSAITARDVESRPVHYAGNAEFQRGDMTEDRVYAGPKTEFLALAPWVVDDPVRDELMTVADQLAPGSGHDREGQYVETAVYADLVPSAVP